MVRSRSRRCSVSRNGSEVAAKGSLQAQKLASCLLKNPCFTAPDTQLESGQQSPARSRVPPRCSTGCPVFRERTQCGFLRPTTPQTGPLRCPTFPVYFYAPAAVRLNGPRRSRPQVPFARTRHSAHQYRPDRSSVLLLLRWSGILPECHRSSLHRSAPSIPLGCIGRCC